MGRGRRRGAGPAWKMGAGPAWKIGAGAGPIGPLGVPQQVGLGHEHEHDLHQQ